jgi:hypothetical protein
MPDASALRDDTVQSTPGSNVTDDAATGTAAKVDASTIPMSFAVFH